MHTRVGWALKGAAHNLPIISPCHCDGVAGELSTVDSPWWTPLHCARVVHSRWVERRAGDRPTAELAWLSWEGRRHLSQLHMKVWKCCGITGSTYNLKSCNGQCWVIPYSCACWMEIHWRVALFKIELTVTPIPVKSGSLIKLNPEGRGSVWKELNWMAGPEGGLTTHSCSAWSTKGARKKTVVQLWSPLHHQEMHRNHWKQSENLQWEEACAHHFPCQHHVWFTSCLHCPAVVCSTEHRIVSRKWENILRSWEYEGGGTRGVANYNHVWWRRSALPARLWERGEVHWVAQKRRRERVVVANLLAALMKRK